MTLKKTPHTKLSPIDEYYEDWHAKLGPPKRMSARHLLAAGLVSLAITAFCLGIYVYLWEYIPWLALAIFTAFQEQS